MYCNFNMYLLTYTLSPLFPSLFLYSLHLYCSKEKVRVLATVTEHSKTAKVIVFKKKRRKNYKRKRGTCMCTQMHIKPRRQLANRLGMVEAHVLW